MPSDHTPPAVMPASVFAALLVAGLLLLGFLGGCGHEPVEPATVTVTREVRPVHAGECFAPDPAEPKLSGGNSLATLKTLHAYRAALRRSRTLRKVCARSLAVQS